jgi:hypothetical protein
MFCFLGAKIIKTCSFEKVFLSYEVLLHNSDILVFNAVTCGRIQSTGQRSVSSGPDGEWAKLPDQ